MRALLFALLTLPGCYLSHERAVVDAAVPVADAAPVRDAFVPDASFDAGTDAGRPHLRLIRHPDVVSMTVCAAGEQVMDRFVASYPAPLGSDPATLRLVRFEFGGITGPGRAFHVYRDAVTPSNELLRGVLSSPRWDDADFPDVEVPAGGSVELIVTMDVDDAGSSMTNSVSVPEDGVLWSDGAEEMVGADGLPIRPLINTFSRVIGCERDADCSFCTPVGPAGGCCGRYEVTPAPFYCGYNPGTLVKNERLAAVYVLARDGRRYVFPTPVELQSWFGRPDDRGLPTEYTGYGEPEHICDHVFQLTDDELRMFPVGGRTITIRPGVYLVGIASMPGRLWVVARGGVLREVTPEIAEALYPGQVEDRTRIIDDRFLGAYCWGEPLTSTSDFDPVMEAATTLLDELERPHPCP